MHVLVATDAWHPQVNGVVRSLQYLAREAAALGHRVTFLTPDGFPSLPLPSYPGIRIALCRPSRVARAIEASGANFIHVATEGPVGFAARRHCLKVGRPFTTSYHTKFPEYLRARAPVPTSWSYAWLRRFHNAAAGVMVATKGLEDELAGRGFRRLMRWSRGVDADLFRPGLEAALDAPRPIFLTVGRLAVEKNIEAMLKLDLPGTKVVVGDGPDEARLRARYPDAVFLGLLEGEALAKVYAAADVFVFPSRTDTFGIVMLEAAAAGLPVAAYPVAGPLDVMGQSDCAALDEDLRAAALRALEIPREACRAFALAHSWRTSTHQFFENIGRAQRAAQRDAGLADVQILPAGE